MHFNRELVAERGAEDGVPEKINFVYSSGPEMFTCLILNPDTPRAGRVGAGRVAGRRGWAELGRTGRR